MKEKRQKKKMEPKMKEERNNNREFKATMKKKWK